MSESNAVSTAEVANPFAPMQVAAAPTGAMAEMATQAVITELQSMVISAKRFPRDPIKSMQRILQSCMRPGLAEDATYAYSRGGSDVTGPSIRLAEELARSWGNIASGVREISRHNGYSEYVAYALDLETNYRDEKYFQVRHWRDTKKGGYQLTDERDIYELGANLAARRKRACILAIMPSDVVETALQQCDVTLKAKVTITPELLQKIVAQFETFRVTKAMIEKRIQRSLDSITPAGVLQLGKIYNSLKDQMGKVEDFFEVDPAAVVAKGGNESVKDALKTKSAEAKKEPSKEPQKAAAPPADDKVPYYTAQSAIAALKVAKNEAAANLLFDEICAEFRDREAALPVEVEAAFNDRIESFGQV